MKQAFVVLFCLCVSAAAFADAKLVQKVKSDPVMGQPAQNNTLTIYVKGQKARIETQGVPQYQILDVPAQKMFIVDPQKKTIMVVTGAQMKQASGMLSQLMGGGKQLAPPSVQKLGSAKSYNGYKCEEYKVSMSAPFPTSGVYCVSSEINLDKELEGLKSFSQEFAQMSGGDVMTEIQGYPVHTDSNITLMGQSFKSSTDLVSFSRENQPESLFIVPKDYAVQELPMPKMNQ